MSELYEHQLEYLKIEQENDAKGDPEWLKDEIWEIIQERK